MSRSSGSYLDGIKDAEQVALDSYNLDINIEQTLVGYSKTLSFYYDGKDFCEGFYDYINHYLDNEKLILEHAKVIVEFKNEA